ncbi:MAG: aspartate/glutamate racemase family protein [Congregibacter sp.]
MPTELTHHEQSTGSVRVWGHRARLGLIVPTTNTVNEAEWAAMVPDGVTVHSARMTLHHYKDSDSVDGLPDSLAEGIAALTPADMSCIAYGCTAGSMINPVEALPAAMAAAANCPCTSTAASIVAALHALEATRIAIATPYHDGLNQHEVAFLNEQGVQVTAIAGLGIGAGGPQEYAQLAHLSQDTVRKHATQTFRSAPAEALLLSCTDMPTLPLISELEHELGVPVISSNTATLWRALSLAKVATPVTGAGALLAQHR